jgi:hypothetical protein
MCSCDNALLAGAVYQTTSSSLSKKDDFCEIEHYCYAMNFGKIGENA